MNIICAYTVNLDAVCNVRASDLIPLMPPQLSMDKIRLRNSISRLDDLLFSLLFCMKEGFGAEILIDRPEVAGRIEESFSWQMRLGGNAGIMANLLADLGAKPTINAPALGPRLAAMLHPGVQVPLSGSLEEPGLAALRNVESAAEPVHFVFQFQTGDRVEVGRERFAVPQSNRFIASYDPVNTILQSSRNFDSYCLENISGYDGALVSGFHLVPLSDYKRVFQEKTDQLQSWKDRNPDLFIHLETGSFQSQRILSHLLDQISRVPVDSLGMNEDEVGAAAGAITGSPSAKPPASWEECMQAAELLQEGTGVFRVAVHTRDYILSVMKEGRLAVQDEISALEKGVEAAASLAATGSLDAAPPGQFNEKGLRAVEEFCCQGGAAEGTGAALRSGGRIFSLVASRLVVQPRITVGLGDTATASIFFWEVGAIKRMRNPV